MTVAAEADVAHEEFKRRMQALEVEVATFVRETITRDLPDVIDVLAEPQAWVPYNTRAFARWFTVALRSQADRLVDVQPTGAAG
ncbi:hypothetical protein [Nocardioides sp.]|uniref:hypothetical protein n=1 Tax=Nocardioides sp. TaxID=35761 RepID=UPI00261C016F|nr:hypothetical protein [Nocardioides sp.]